MNYLCLLSIIIAGLAVHRGYKSFNMYIKTDPAKETRAGRPEESSSQESPAEKIVRFIWKKCTPGEDLQWRKFIETDKALKKFISNDHCYKFKVEPAGKIRDQRSLTMVIVGCLNAETVEQFSKFHKAKMVRKDDQIVKAYRPTPMTKKDFEHPDYANTLWEDDGRIQMKKVFEGDLVQCFTFTYTRLATPDKITFDGCSLNEGMVFSWNPRDMLKPEATAKEKRPRSEGKISSKEFPSGKVVRMIWKKFNPKELSEWKSFLEMEETALKKFISYDHCYQFKFEPPEKPRDPISMEYVACLNSNMVDILSKFHKARLIKKDDQYVKAYRPTPMTKEDFEHPDYVKSFWEDDGRVEIKRTFDGDFMNCFTITYTRLISSDKIIFDACSVIEEALSPLYIKEKFEKKYGKIGSRTFQMPNMPGQRAPTMSE